MTIRFGSRIRRRTFDHARDAVRVDEFENRAATFKVLKNRFETSNPTAHLGVGDFDGDQKEDLFHTMGADWYYSPAEAPNGVSYTRIPNRWIGWSSETSTEMADRRPHGAGNTWLASWTGASQWDTINQ